MKKPKQSDKPKGTVGRKAGSGRYNAMLRVPVTDDLMARIEARMKETGNPNMAHVVRLSLVKDLGGDA